jgi:hypothetical protein
MFRRLAAAIAALTLVLLVAAPALAGGWAEIVADTRTEEPPPVEGQPFEVGFTVLQHGETPAGWESPTVTFTEVATGKSFQVAATGSGGDGHFVATAAMPTSGFWTWSVSLRDLATDPVVHALAVLTPDGVAPVLDPAMTLAAIDRARHDVTTELTGTLSTEMERINAQLDGQRAIAAGLTAKVDRIATERDALATRLGAAEEALAAGGTGLPLLGIVTLAILAGASAGFGMAWLAGRSRPRALEVSADPGSPQTPAVSPRGSMPG